MIRATVSGSFHRHIVAIYEHVGTLRSLGVDVLSPADPRVVDNIGEFLFVASDKVRAVKLVQDRHLEAIRASDFLLVAAPDGYTGASTSGEIMAAAVLSVPVYSLSPVLDITIREYVRFAQSIEEIVSLHTSTARVCRGYPIQPMLLNPIDSTRQAISDLERIGKLLDGRTVLSGQELTVEAKTLAGKVSTSLGFLNH